MVGYRERNAEIVHQTLNKSNKFVWRNKMTDGYKIGASFKDVPLDLSNYLLIRTRENILFRNKQLQKDVFRNKSFADNFKRPNTSENYTNDALIKITRDIEQGMIAMNRLFFINNERVTLPVAFATNTLYVLARNGLAQTP